MRLPSVAAALVLSTVLLAACAASPPSADDPSSRLSGDLLVFAAASLTDAVEDLAAVFEDAHPDVEVVANLAGSQALAAQVLAGEPADVFASADAAHVDVLDEAGLVASREPFATNRLVIAVETGNPLDIGALGDLARDEVLLVLAADEVPAGRYAAEALASAGVEVSPVSLEVDVRAALGKVVLGEADAAIVYASDVVAADGAVDRVDLADEHDVVASYPVARLVEAPNRAAADAFVAFLRTEPAQQVLRRHGFLAP